MKKMLLFIPIFGMACNCNSESTPPTTDVQNIDTSDVGVDNGTPDTNDFLSCGSVGTQMASIQDWTIEVSNASGSWTLSKDEQFVVGSPSNCDGVAIRTGVGQPFVENGVGAFRIELETDRSEISWETHIGVPILSNNSGVVRLEYPNGARLLFSDDEGNVRVQLDADADAGELSWNCEEETAFFGLGSQATGMDLRGRTFPLWTQEQGNGKPEGGRNWPLRNFPEAAYAPMGVWHTSEGYSGLVTHDGYSEIDLCETASDVVSLRSVNAQPGWVVIAEDDLRQRIEVATDYTGRANVDLPPWAFGVWINSVRGPWRINDVVSRIRFNNVPVSAIWSEDWIGAEENAGGFRLSYRWTWDEEQYPNLPQIIDLLQSGGFAFLGYFNPFVPNTVPHFQEGDDNHYLIRNASEETYLLVDPAFRQASLVDLFNPDSRTWLSEFQRAAIQDVGLNGWMADFAEWLPVDAVTGPDNVDGWARHNLYPVEWQRANRAAFESYATDPWVFFARSGWASANGGTPGVVPAMWAGDHNTNWEFDDGIPSVVPIGLHTGLSGVAMWGTDIAGYNALGSGPATKELFLRWSAMAAFFPLMRTHHGGEECENWSFDRDDETLQQFKRFAQIHTRLYPVFRDLYEEAKSTGLPILRHPYLVEPANESFWRADKYLFFLGDNILVSPVIEEGIQDVWVTTLPSAGWWTIFGTAPLIDAQAVTSAFVTELPVYLRPGTALVTHAIDVDTFFPESDIDITGLDEVKDHLAVALYYDPDGSASGDSSDVTISATGLRDWVAANVQVDGQALTACNGTPVDCVDGNIVKLTERSDVVTLTSGTASVTITPKRTLAFDVGIGGDTWGDLRNSPPIDLGSQSPSWCEREPVNPD